MDENTKKIILIVVVILAVVAAGFSAFKTMAGPQEEVVGELPMPPGGGRDAEAGSAGQQPAGGDPSGMPAEMR